MCRYNNIEEKTAHFFGKDSPLRKASEHGGRKYEERPQQKETALCIAESLSTSENLCIEAPTGLGKSIAYLVPSIYHSLKTKTPVIIATETINLQEQLVKKDLPLLKELTGLNFRYAIAKGKGNYLCKRRLKLAMSKYSKDYLSENVMPSGIARIAKWSEYTQDGSKDSLDFIPKPYLWKSICCEFNNCMSTKCIYRDSCFYNKAYSSWKIANVVITNHSMFFSDLKKKISGKGYIFEEFSGLIIDEAHSLENSAAKHLGSEINELKVYEYLKKLYNPFTSRGLLAIYPENTRELMNTIILALDEVKTFFNILRSYVEEKEKTSRRIKEKIKFNNSLLKILSDIRDKLFIYMHMQEDKEFKLEINNQLMVCHELIEIFSNAFDMTDNNAFWGEVTKEKSNDSVVFKYAPLNIAEILNKYVFNNNYSVVLTSATLAVNNNLNYYKGRVGFTGRDKILTSPFDYKENVTLYLESDDIYAQNKNTDNILAEKIGKYVSMTSGKALVLFTSYKTLRKAKNNTSDFFHSKGIRLFVQGEELNRTDMLVAFKTDINSVLFGTSSFWTGVDVPGDALSNVIITKLPFPVPTEPIIEARCDIIKQKGGNPFEEYILPEAIIKFKQGFGRLIRSRKDKGIIVILDNRIKTKPYGLSFLASIPECRLYSA